MLISNKGNLKKLNEKQEAEKLLKTIYAMLDKLAKNNIIHSNKAANDKSKLTKFCTNLQPKPSIN